MAAAVGVVVLCGTLAMFIYPALFAAVPALAASPRLMGIYTGSTVVSDGATRNQQQKTVEDFQLASIYRALYHRSPYPRRPIDRLRCFLFAQLTVRLID